jgi:hypothetical protein
MSKDFKHSESLGLLNLPMTDKADFPLVSSKNQCHKAMYPCSSAICWKKLEYLRRQWKPITLQNVGLKYIIQTGRWE